MGEIRLEIPNTLHAILKYQAASQKKRLPVLIREILKAYTYRITILPYSEDGTKVIK